MTVFCKRIHSLVQLCLCLGTKQTNLPTSIVNRKKKQGENPEISVRKKTQKPCFAISFIIIRNTIVHVRQQAAFRKL